MSDRYELLLGLADTAGAPLGTMWRITAENTEALWVLFLGFIEEDWAMPPEIFIGVQGSRGAAVEDRLKDDPGVSVTSAISDTARKLVVACES